MDHPYIGNSIKATSNIPRDHKVTQVIEPVVNSITNAIKSTFTQRNEIERADHVPTNWDYYDAANEIDSEFPTYTYPLDYDYDNAMQKYSATQTNPYKQLYNLKSIYSKRPRRKPTQNKFTPMNTARSERAYYVYRPRTTQRRYY